MADPVAGLGMSLDDIIASKKSETGAGRGRGRGGFRGRGGGGDRGGGRFGAGGRGGGHLGARPMSASGISKASSAPANVRVIIPNQAASHHGHQQQQQPQGQGFEGSELRVTNLAFKVTEADVRELFSAIGRLRRTAVDRRPNGESAGAASVAYYNAADCDRAIRTYDGVALDGRPMRVVKVGAGGGVRALSSGLQLGGQSSRRVVIAGGDGGGGGGGGGSRVVSVMRTTGGSRGGGGGGSSRGGGGGGGSRGGGRVRANVTKLDAAELDAQLDTYMKGE